MSHRPASLIVQCLVVLGAVLGSAAAAQEPVLRSAIVTLAEDPGIRAEFERGLTAKARENDYDAATTYDLVPDADDLDDQDLIETLAERGFEAILMLRPAAIGPGSSLESVRNEISPELFSDVQKFARETSPTGSDDLIAVVHMAIYAIMDEEAEFISAGVVWLDEEVESQAEGIDRLQDLIVYNVNAVRPSIRRHLGLPPLQ